MIGIEIWHREWKLVHQSLLGCARETQVKYTEQNDKRLLTWKQKYKHLEIKVERAPRGRLVLRDRRYDWNVVFGIRRIKQWVESTSPWRDFYAVVKTSKTDHSRKLTQCVISQLPNLCMGTSGTPLQYVTGDRLDAFFYWTRFIWKQCTIWQYHSDLSDQSALQIRVTIRVRHRVVLFWHFSQRSFKSIGSHAHPFCSTESLSTIPGMETAYTQLAAINNLQQRFPVQK